VRPAAARVRLPAAFQHGIPHVAEAAGPNLSMAGWDCFLAIWDNGGSGRCAATVAQRTMAGTTAWR
ncbi:MAG: hypothetical protein OXE96_15160, partial [Gemmatimonadetes bacterium]|nr:hypothetical protein [Gemmatimonadota bacterium]